MHVDAGYRLSFLLRNRVYLRTDAAGLPIASRCCARYLFERIGKMIGAVVSDGF